MNIKSSSSSGIIRTDKSPIVILGGGISGLTAAQAIKRRGRDYIILERCPTIGGLTRSINVSEFCFDYTGHFLHLSHYSSPEDLPYASLDQTEWHKITRNSYCFVAGKLIPAPIQYNIGKLPEPIRKACVDSYELRTILQSEENRSFRDFIISGFGQELADIFLIPQNEKTMSVSLNRLSERAIRRFFPLPDEERIHAGIRGEASTYEYNTTFWYPRTGGIEKLVHGLSQGLRNIMINEEITRIDLKGKTVTTKSNRIISYSHLLSSIPLPSLCRMCSDKKLQKQAEYLSCGSTICINIGLRGPVPLALKGIHWIYVPDRNIPFYRVGCYSNISEGTCAIGHHSLYVEVGVEAGEIYDAENIDQLQSSVFRTLRDLGWLDPELVICTTINIIDCSYVHMTPEREELIDSIVSHLKDGDVRLIGRYGQWDYISMEDCIRSAINVVEEILS